MYARARAPSQRTGGAPPGYIPASLRTLASMCSFVPRLGRRTAGVVALSVTCMTAAAPRVASAQPPGARPPQAPPPAVAPLDFQATNGYFVWATDFWSFWPCGRKGYFYLEAAPEARAKLIQAYRFASLRPYNPVYVQVSAAFVNDTVTAGPYRHTRYVRVNRYLGGDRRTAACAPPLRSAIAEAVYGLDQYRIRPRR